MGWMVGVRFSEGGGNSSIHHCVQTDSGVHPASYPMGTRDSFPRGLSGRSVKLTTHLHLVPRSKMLGATSPLPNTPSWRGAQFKKKRRDNREIGWEGVDWMHVAQERDQ
jgi:hypothetical protein